MVAIIRRNFKIIIVGVLFIVLDILLSFWFILDWKPKVVVELLNRLSPPKTDEVFSFKNIYFQYKQLNPNQNAVMTCFYQNSLRNLPRVKLELGFIQENSANSTKRNSYAILHSENEKLDKGGGAFSKDFIIPDLIPPGRYNAYLRVYDVGRLKIIGGCYSSTFELANSLPPLLVNLKSPSADIGLMPFVKEDNKELTFSLESNTDSMNVKPRFDIKDSPISNKTVFSLDGLQAMTILKNEKKDYKVDLSTFDKTGSFVIDMQFIDQNKKVISSFPIQEVYVGNPPKISEIKDLTHQGNLYKYNVSFTNEIFTQKTPLELNILALDNESHSCGFSNYTVNKTLFQKVNLKIAENCRTPKVISFLLKQKGFDLALARAKK